MYDIFNKLKVLSYVFLVLGLVGCLVMFINLSTVEVIDVREVAHYKISEPETVFSPIGFFGSLGATISVVISFFALRAVAEIGGIVETIHYNVKTLEKTEEKQKQTN